MVQQLYRLRRPHRVNTITFIITYIINETTQAHLLVVLLHSYRQRRHPLPTLHYHQRPQIRHRHFNVTMDVNQIALTIQHVYLTPLHIT